RRERAEREGGPDDADRRRLIEREAEHPTADAVLADGERQEDEQEAVERAQHRAAGERGQDEPPGEDLVAVLLPLPPRDHDQPWEYLGWIGVRPWRQGQRDHHAGEEDQAGNPQRPLRAEPERRR